MARVKFGFGITSINGKVGGSVFSGSRAGPVLKIKPKFKPAHSFAESLRRSYMAILNASWTNLSDENKSLWAAYNGMVPTRTKFNQDYFIDARQLFIKYNFYRLLYEIAILESPDFSVTTLPDITYRTRLIPADIELTLSRLPKLAEEFIICSMSGQIRPTINNPGSRLRSLIWTTTNSLDQHIGDAYTDVFGILPLSGQTVFFKAATISLLAPVIQYSFNIKHTYS